MAVSRAEVPQHRSRGKLRYNLQLLKSRGQDLWQTKVKRGDHRGRPFCFMDARWNGLPAWLYAIAVNHGGRIDSCFDSRTPHV